MKNYELIARTLVAINNCCKSSTQPHPWLARYEAALAGIMASSPSGSGIDNGTELDRDASSDSKLVFHADYHHMDGDSGMYDGWTEHKVIVTPSLSLGFTVRITGIDRNGIKDYLADTFNYWLCEEAEG